MVEVQPTFQLKSEMLLVIDWKPDFLLVLQFVKTATNVEYSETNFYPFSSNCLNI